MSPLNKNKSWKNSSFKDATDDDETDITATSISSTTTLNNDSNSKKINNFQTLIQSQLNEECRQKLVEYLFVNKENTKLYLESNLNDFLGALDNFFQANEANLKSENKAANDINLLCDQIMNIYNDICLIQQHQQSASSAVTNQSMHNSKVEKQVNSVNTSKNSLKLTIFPNNYVNESKQLIGTTSFNFAGEEANSHNLTSTKSFTHNSTESSSSAGVSKEIDIGPFLSAILNRLDHMLSNSLQINFLVTGLIARLAYYPQLLLRSFLLNHNLVMQPNFITLFQMIHNVKFKIDNCSKTYENFSLLYLKAKILLVKRLVDSKSALSDSNKANLQPSQLQNSSASLTPPLKKKSSKMDKFLSVFFKPLIDLTVNEDKNQYQLSEEDIKPRNYSSTPNAPNSKNFYENNNSHAFSNGLLTPQVEIDLNDIRTK